MKRIFYLSEQLTAKEIIQDCKEFREQERKIKKSQGWHQGLVNQYVT